MRRSSFYMVKRDPLRPMGSLLLRLAAILGALFSGGILLKALGHQPLDVYLSMLKGSFGTATASEETVKMAIPLLITAIGISLAFRMRFWNIGGEGQILVGGIFATGTLLYFPDLPYPLRLLSMALAAALGAGVFGMIPAFFKTRWNTNETLFTLMLNYIAFQWVRYLQYQKAWQDPGTRFPKIFIFGEANSLPQVFGVHVGWIFALVLMVLAVIYLSHSKQGYEIAVVGGSPNTARYAGMNVRRITLRTLFLSAAICGLAGFFQVAGADGTLTEGTAGGVGFTAITVAWLAKLSPTGMGLVALLIALLEKGSISIQSTHQIPAAAADLLIGLILFFMLGFEFFTNYAIKRQRRSKA